MLSIRQTMSVLQLLFILGLIPGAVGDNYNIGSFIAASVVAFVLFAIVIAMAIGVFWWNSWFDGYQKTKGRIKVPREWLMKRKIETNSVIDVEKYEMNAMNQKRRNEMENVHSTFAYNSEAADWVQDVNTDGNFEVKTKAMDLEEEDHGEPLIVTEVLRDSAVHQSTKGDGLTSL